MAKRSFTPETVILDALEADERVAGVFKKLNLHCLECIAVFKETLQDAARYHNTALDRILDELNRLNIPQP